MSTNYLSDGVQRAIRALLLIESASSTVKPNAIAAHLECSPALATRTMENLAHAGMAERTPDGLWQAGPALRKWRRNITRHSLEKIMEAM